MILTFGTYDAGRHPRVAILADGLRAHGADVAELNRPLGFSTAERVRMLQQPWRLPLLVVRLLACWAGLTAGAARFRRAHGRPAAVLVGYLGHFDVVLARVLFPRSVVVLDHLIFAGDTASDRGAAGLRVRLLNGLDRLAIACADVVVTDTDEHREMLPAAARRKGVTALVGAPATWFEVNSADPAHTPPSPTRFGGRPRALRASPEWGQRKPRADQPNLVVDGAAAGGGPGSVGAGRLSVVFFGLYTPLQGAPVIAEGIRAAIGQGARFDVTMIGSGQELDTTREILGDMPGVTWHDWVEPGDLPAIVGAHDVCLGIFSDTPKGLRVVPNKVYQGLAAGCVVVTSDTPPQRRAVGDVTELVPPADADALAKKLTELTDPDRLAEARARAASGRDRIRPGAVVEPLADVLDTRCPAALRGRSANGSGGNGIASGRGQGGAA
ncbi:glycosyltransferase [Myceligenerans crystallogenes]|uniref:Glycosyltransferase n=1 Tax=Myceligenerans crystallogenes TaxID=316335 RepID=A0ABN2NEM0_9MICO